MGGVGRVGSVEREGTVEVPDVLRRIVEARRRRYGVEPGAPSPSPSPSGSGVARDSGESAPNAFVGALRERRGRAVIAEIKLGSPRLGSLVGRVDVERQAATYGRGGAAALSVVVEPDFFFGSWDLLRRAKAASGLPALAKDFVVSERQLAEAAEAGADAILLVAALYSAPQLLAWAAAARSFGLVPLVETHIERDVSLLAGAGGAWELVGVNSRDLRDFSVDLEGSIALLPRLPGGGTLRVAESGIRHRRDLDRLAAAGFDAFLVGESLLRAEDPAAQLASLTA